MTHLSDDRPFATREAIASLLSYLQNFTYRENNPMAVIDQLFDEAFYLESYPDVAVAVAAGQIPSGRSHFLPSGLQEGRTLISRFYRDDVEAQYLSENPDVAAVVRPGGLASGLQHYLGIGESEGQSLFSDGFDEEWYRRRYPDVAEAISLGVFTSGLEHYLAFGRGEIRSVSPLFELDYFNTYPDIEAARDGGGIYLSAADHYSVTGNFEGRQATFGGTSGDDTVVGGAAIDTLTGVQLDVADVCRVGRILIEGPCREYDSIGLNEQDVLIGGPGLDSFRLGIFLPVPDGPIPFYQGNGDVDFARIVDFEPGRDSLLLATRKGPDTGELILGTEFETTPEGIKVYAINDLSDPDISGFPLGRDLMAIVEGITNPNDVINSTVFLTGGSL